MRLLATQNMPMQITIKPSDHAFPCDADETVLQAAMRADLMIPYGCRNGACGTCKGKIIGGDVDYGAYQRSTLSEDEKRAGLALFCCAKPLTDLVIEVREVRRAGGMQMRPCPWRAGQMPERGTHGATVRLRLPATEPREPLVGQD